MERKKNFMEKMKRSGRRKSVLDALPTAFPAIIPEELAVAVKEPYIPNKPVRRSKSDPPPSTQTGPVSKISTVESIPDVQFEPDYNIMSEKVFSLNHDNFDAFIRSKEKALIVFYKSFQSENVDFEADFASTAEGSTNEKHGFGAVDCCFNRDLCADEKVCCTPVLKLYSNGYEVGNIISAKKFTAAQMNMMVKMTPILTKPKVNLNASMDVNPAANCSTSRKRTSLIW